LRPTGEWLNQPGGLAERLVRIRKAAGLTGDQLAARLGWARSKVPKIENGRQMPTDADIRAWTEACGELDEGPALLELLSDARAVHRQWRHQLRSGHAALQVEFDTLVRQAKRIRNFELLLIPGLLQTPDYARYRALEAVRLHGTAPERVEETVVARMRRQEVLYDTGKTFEFVITEAALRYLLCPPQVMRAQLDRLLGVPGLSHVTFGIIPPGRELPIAPMAGFLMADDVTIVETFTSEVTLRGEESAKYGEIADGLMNEAVTGDEARHLIAAAAAALRQPLPESAAERVVSGR
jgi:transcriptional regulator with XRE-family HTH domain